jgi:peptidoglycan/LPS O-acetylase OafA/YrhL
MEPASRWLVMITFLMTAASCIWLEQMRHGRFPLFAERMVYIPLTVTLILLLTDLFRCMPGWCHRVFIFLGSLSLEIYLIHNHFVMQYLIPYHLGYWPTMLLTTLLTLPLAWLLQQTLKRLCPQ